MWPSIALVTVEEGLDVLTLLAPMGKLGRSVSCVAERDSLTRRAPQPGFDHGSSSPSEERPMVLSWVLGVSDCDRAARVDRQPLLRT
jgi:hypothetical protein